MKYIIYILLLIPFITFAQLPNVVIIIADDLGWDDALFGDSLLTPNINSIATNGVMLNQNYVDPVCSPTRFELMTSLYSENYVSEVLRCSDGALPETTPDSIYTLYESFQDAGYATALIGKWHLIDTLTATDDLPFNEGIDYFYGCLGGDIDYFTRVDVCGDYDWWEDTTGTPISEAKATYVTQDIKDKSIEWIGDQTGNYFIQIAFTSPHNPYQNANDPSYRFVGGVDGTDWLRQGTALDYDRTYKNMIIEMDHAIGKILDSIDDNTIVYFVSDNGSATTIGNIGTYHNLPKRGGKGDFFNGGIVTPTAIMWKGHIPKGKEINAITSIRDVYPTLAELCGLKVYEYAQGSSFARMLFSNQSDINPIRKIFGWQSGDVDSIIYSIEGCYKYIYDSGEDTTERIFNICDDPNEVHNLYPTYSSADLLTNFNNWVANNYKE